MKANRLNVWMASMATLSVILFQCNPKTNQDTAMKELKISLAEWSVHKAIKEDSTLNPDDFPNIAADYGISAIEWVSQFYKSHGTDASYWNAQRKKCDSIGLKSVLIMVDDEGDLGSADASARKTAVENHYKWIDAAAILGCHSIRLNAFGDGTKDDMRAAMIESLKQLCLYAAKQSINVIIENHGLYSSDAQWVASVIKGVDMPNCGTLPDFGNWCTSQKWGSIQVEKKCETPYDPYQGVSELLPFAKGVSAKSYGFDASGNETTIDYSRMIKLVKESNFEGYIGIEFEGNSLTEPEGIKATKALIEKTWSELK